MSEIGGVMDAVLAHVVAEIPTAQTKRRLVLLDSIAHFPTCLAYLPVETASALDRTQQREVGLLTRYSLVDTFAADDEGAQETQLARLDAIRDRIHADPTLGAQVRRSWVSERRVDEYPETSRIVAVFEVTTERHQ